MQSGNNRHSAGCVETSLLHGDQHAAALLSLPHNFSIFLLHHTPFPYIPTHTRISTCSRRCRVRGSFCLSLSCQHSLSLSSRPPPLSLPPSYLSFSLPLPLPSLNFLLHKFEHSKGQLPVPRSGAGSCPSAMRVPVVISRHFLTFPYTHITAGPEFFFWPKRILPKMADDATVQTVSDDEPVESFEDSALAAASDTSCEKKRKAN
jgi:hypothetical protein